MNLNLWWKLFGLPMMGIAPLLTAIAAAIWASRARVSFVTLMTPHSAGVFMARP